MSAIHRSFPVALGAAALAVALAGCGGGGGGSDAAAPAAGGVELVSDGVLTTCTHLPYEPFQFQDGAEIVGFDVDMVDLVAAKLGVEQQIIDMPFDGIQSGAAFDSGQCDIGAAAMTITEERKQNIDFSDPYFEATQALLVQEASGISDPAGLAGKKVGVQNSTTGQEYAENNITGSEIVVFEDLGLLTTAVQTGTVDAGIADNGPLLDFAKKNPGLAVTAEFRTDEQYGFGVRKGNTALLQVVNESIAASKADGTYNQIYEKWFGQAPTQG
ncbi:basic amino acid ABC transporter substrate-binding protein [Pseudonocardia zijingensis]|uniref:Basic amino acid ABC transporter substrate-binding protein n=1 Tax=Pseudonocardia zijingensis TaxID=153376 RepID=A0ABP4B0F8_9PSEU